MHTHYVGRVIRLSSFTLDLVNVHFACVCIYIRLFSLLINSVTMTPSISDLIPSRHMAIHYEDNLLVYILRGLHPSLLQHPLTHPFFSQTTPASPSTTSSSDDSSLQSSYDDMPNAVEVHSLLQGLPSDQTEKPINEHEPNPNKDLQIECRWSFSLEVSPPGLQGGYEGLYNGESNSSDSTPYSTLIASSPANVGSGDGPQSLAQPHCGGDSDKSYILIS